MKTLLLLLAAAALTACRSIPAMTTPTPQVDIPRYMGDWYVIGGIPSPLERDAFNAIENYSLEENGTIKTTFTYRKGSFHGKPKKIEARGFVKDDPSHAVWGMQFIWPIKSDYRIAWISPDYTQVVVAREKRDYVWIMARSPVVSDADYARLEEFAVSLGYDAAQIKRSPQDGAARKH
jgi:apolipoprotein D and lipocalin family protein